MNSGDLIERCPHLTHRKLDYWCHNGIFDDNKVVTRRAVRRDFTEEELKIARVLARVSHAFDEWSNGRGGFVAVYKEIANQIRAGVQVVEVVLAGGITLHVATFDDPIAAPDAPPAEPEPEPAQEVGFIPGVGADNA